MIRIALALRTLALAFWFGGGLATLVATSTVFAKTGDRKAAGDLAGAILERTGRVRDVTFFLMVLAIGLGAVDRAALLGLFCALLQGVGVVVNVLVRRARRAAGGSIEALPPGDPRRRRFAALHGAAMLVLVVQVAAAGVGLALAG